MKTVMRLTKQKAEIMGLDIPGRDFTTFYYGMELDESKLSSAGKAAADYISRWDAHRDRWNDFCAVYPNGDKFPVAFDHYGGSYNTPERVIEKKLERLRMDGAAGLVTWERDYIPLLYEVPKRVYISKWTPFEPYDLYLMCEHIPHDFSGNVLDALIQKFGVNVLTKNTAVIGSDDDCVIRLFCNSEDDKWMPLWPDRYTCKLKWPGYEER